MTTLDHVSISTGDYAKSLGFYEAALAPLGIKTLMQFEGQAAGLGTEMPFFWIGAGGTRGNVHVAFSADNRAAVDAFHAAALAAGGKDNGAPGIRENYSPTYYAAFVFDPDGNNIEAVCHAPA